MKTYFAKYLPVEGEESGKPSGTTTYYGQPISPNAREFLGKLLREDVGWDMYETLKLFLCSRDIQVGDKVVDIDENEYIYKGNIQIASVTQYKVIGEISPDAFWVKERDEFDENDVTSTWICNQHSWRDCSCKSNLSQGYLIKGPCGHFH